MYVKIQREFYIINIILKVVENKYLLFKLIYTLRMDEKLHGYCERFLHTLIKYLSQLAFITIPPIQLLNPIPSPPSGSTD